MPLNADVNRSATIFPSVTQTGFHALSAYLKKSLDKPVPIHLEPPPESSTNLE
jgi:hypothetical protein